MTPAIQPKSTQKEFLFKIFNQSKQKTCFQTISFKSPMLANPVIETSDIRLIVAAFAMIAQNGHLHYNTR